MVPSKKLCVHWPGLLQSDRGQPTASHLQIFGNGSRYLAHSGPVKLHGGYGWCTLKGLSTMALVFHGKSNIQSGTSTAGLLTYRYEILKASKPMMRTHGSPQPLNFFICEEPQLNRCQRMQECSKVVPPRSPRPIRCPLCFLKLLNSCPCYEFA